MEEEPAAKESVELDSSKKERGIRQKEELEEDEEDEDIYDDEEEEDEDSPSLTPSPTAQIGAAGTVPVPPPVTSVMGTGTFNMVNLSGIGIGIGIAARDVPPSSSPSSLSLMTGGGPKKRGRPRKYGADMLMSPSSSSPHPALCSSDQFSSSSKRGRGRPPGSGRRQLLATLGEWFARSAGGSFTPHVITIGTGEDVAARMLSLSQKGPRAVCILSANGAISNVTLRQPGSSGGTLTYEGRFEILSLSGSFTIMENNGVRSRTGGISVSLAGPNGRVVGGGVAGLLLAASPIQVVVGSFLPNAFKEHGRRSSLEPSPSILSAAPTSIPTTTGVLTSAMPLSQVNPERDGGTTPNSTMAPVRSQENKTSSETNRMIPTSVGWHGFLQSSSEHRASPDINISLPGE